MNDLNLYNNSLTEIDVSQNVNLTFLDLGANQLADVNVTNNTLLQTLFLDGNQLMSLDVSNNGQLAKIAARIATTRGRTSFPKRPFFKTLMNSRIP